MLWSIWYYKTELHYCLLICCLPIRINGRPPLTMDAISATVSKTWVAVELNLIMLIFQQFILTHHKRPQPNPSPSEEVTRVGSGSPTDTTPYEGQMAPPWWWCLWDGCVGVNGTFRTIPTVEILRDKGFLFPPEPLLVKSCQTRKWPNVDFFVTRND
jgi:hypothetical protein